MKTKNTLLSLLRKNASFGKEKFLLSRMNVNVSAENFSIECNRDSQITRMSAPLFLDSMRLTSIDVYGGNEFLVFSIQVF